MRARPHNLCVWVCVLQDTHMFVY